MRLTEKEGSQVHHYNLAGEKLRRELSKSKKGMKKIEV